MADKDKGLITAVAELLLVFPNHETLALDKERVKGFDKAWHRALELPKPVQIKPQVTYDL